MTKDQLLLSFDLLDEQYIEEASPTAAKPHRRRIQLVRAATCAVLIAILVPAILLVLPLFRTPTEVPPVVYDPPTIFNALESPELLYGNGNPFVVGDTTEVVDFSDTTEPLSKGFGHGYYIVHAEIISILPDVYYPLNRSPNFAPNAYQLIRFRTLEALHGNVPEEFLYLMPMGVVDNSFDSYDTFIISMGLRGTENYILRNGSKQKLEAFPLLLFADPNNCPEIGNFISFTDGVFNENVFHYYDTDLVQPGYTVEYTLTRVKERIKESKQEIEDSGYYSFPIDILTYSTDFTTEEARAAFAYVQAFENGVFVQSICSYFDAAYPTLTYTRYIGECQTEEVISINLETEEVTYSEVRYSEEELRSIVNVSEYAANLREKYAAQLPVPPHTDTQGKELYSLNVFGWYLKIDGNIYGIVKTTWLYHEKRYDEEYHCNVLYRYYDDSFILLDAQNLTVREVSRDELLELTGGQDFHNYIHQYRYNYAYKAGYFF